MKANSIEVAQIEVLRRGDRRTGHRYSSRDVVPEREGNGHRVYAQGVYAAIDDDEWVPSRCATIRTGPPSSTRSAGPNCSTTRDSPTAGTADNHEAFDDILSGRTAGRPPDEIVEALFGRGVPAEWI